METANAELFRETMGTLKRLLLKRRIDLGHLEGAWYGLSPCGIF